MTDKQIMIDGCDVSGCVCFANWHVVMTGQGLVINEIENACTTKQKPCTNIKDCMFKKLAKQLKSKEQELEKYKIQFNADTKEMDGYQNEIVRHLESIEYLRTQLRTKEQECDQLKAENEKLKQYKTSKQASYETMQIEWNEAKNEVKQLKTENKNIVNCYKNNLLVLNHEELVNNKLTNRCLKLEQALQEIKNFIYIEKAKVFVDMEDFWEQILQKCEVIDE